MTGFFTEARNSIDLITFDKLIQEQKTVHERKVRGKIAIWSKSYALVEYDGEVETTRDGLIFFRELELRGFALSELNVGDEVEFDVVYNEKSKIYVAENVYPVNLMV